jgi:hypothetical protein
MKDRREEREIKGKSWRKAAARETAGRCYALINYYS